MFAYNKGKILIIEANNCHGEVLPGYINYFKKMGYNIDVIITPELAIFKPLFMFAKKFVNFIVVDKDKIGSVVFTDDNILLYKYILINSQILYRPVGEIWKEFNFFDIYPSAERYKDKIIFVQHHANLYKKSLQKVIMLEDFDIIERMQSMACPPFFYGKIKITMKNKDITDFILIGAIENDRRNYNLLIDAISGLHIKNISNFRITVIGKGNLPEPCYGRLSKYFQILGETDFPTLYSAVEQSDYILLLFDPENKKHIEKYIHYGTSGNFQLSYGFRKPCLLHSKFAQKRGLNKTNALVYESNSELAKTMKEAIELTRGQYKKLQNNLGKISKKLYKNSLTTLKRICKEENYD
jgi:hypothetical protein